MHKRKARNSHFSKQSLLVPFDCLDFGDPEKDPCFGKHYDLMDDTCLTCGDIEWCSIIFNQKLQSKRLAEENKGSNYDMKIDNLEFEKEVLEYWENLIETYNMSDLKAVFRTAKRFSINRPRVKQILDL